MKSQHFSLISPGRGHGDLTKWHQNYAENVFWALWLQNIWFCAFSQFSIKFHFGRMKCFARRLSDFLSLLPVPEANAATLASRSIWQLYAWSKVSPEPFAVIRTVSSDASGASKHDNFPYRLYQCKKENDFPVCISAHLLLLTVSTVAEKA